jgi:hypothetical protein
VVCAASTLAAAAATKQHYQKDALAQRSQQTSGIHIEGHPQTLVMPAAGGHHSALRSAGVRTEHHQLHAVLSILGSFEVSLERRLHQQILPQFAYDVSELNRYLGDIIAASTTAT